MKTVLYLFLIFIFFNSVCTQLTYEHEAEIDFATYQTAYIMTIDNAEDWFWDDDHAYLVEYLAKKIERKSDFTAIYDAYRHSSSWSETVDCIIDVRLKSMRKEEEIHEEDRTIEIKCDLELIVWDRADSTVILRATEDDEESESISNYLSTDQMNDRIYDLRIEAMKNCLDEIASHFLKDLEI